MHTSTIKLTLLMHFSYFANCEYLATGIKILAFVFISCCFYHRVSMSHCNLQLTLSVICIILETRWLGWYRNWGIEWTADELRFKLVFSSPQCPDQLWCPPSLLSNGYHGFLPQGQSGRGMKLTTHISCKGENGGAIPPLPHKSSWRGT
jgi:hypothetical protein